LAIVFGLGFLIYTLFFKPIAPESTVTPESKRATSTAGLPGTQAGQGQVVTPGQGELPGTERTTQETTPTVSNVNSQLIYKTQDLTQTPTLGATLSGSGSKLQYYDSQSEKFYSLDKNGEITPLSDKVFHSVQKITWSPDKNKAILEYPDDAKIIYDFNTQKQITLPKHWKDFDFEPDGNNIVMKSIGLDPDNRWLAITSADGSTFRPIESLGEKDESVYPAWSPNKQVIAVFSEGIDFDRQEVYFVGLNHENFKSTVVEGRGFEPKWTPDGSSLLYSVYSSKTDLKPSLWLVDAQGENIGNNRRSLGIATWASKCVFAGSQDLYCAVPENLEEGAGLMPELAASTKDDLYKIDLRTGVKKLIAIPDSSYNISNIIVPSDQNYIYFTDKATQKLHKIKL